MRYWLLLVILCVGNSLYSGEIVFSGTYQGKDIYIQNPYNQSTRSFCVASVFVNDRQVLASPKITAIKVDLSYLSLNELVVIRIMHHDSCKPRVVNAHVLKKTGDFQFLTMEADDNSLMWTTRGELPGGGFILEQWTEETDWAVIDTIEAKGGNIKNNIYAHSAPHAKGQNKYRVQYVNAEGLRSYSMEAYFTKSKYITFHPEIATSTITLSDTAQYKITDYYGKLVKQGEGTEVVVRDLKPGAYYISINNRKSKFIKK